MEFEEVPSLLRCGEPNCLGLVKATERIVATRRGER